MAVILLPPAPVSQAQSVTTVRETEFRSRWENFNVDLPRETPASEPILPGNLADAQHPVIRSVRSFFRNSPVALRGGMTVGWESSNERRSVGEKSAAASSFFAAPAIAVIYDREVGPWAVSVRYSAGYVYYFDPAFLGSGNSGIQSQTAAVEFQHRGTRLDLRSSAAASYGSGFDIARTQQTDRLSVSERFSADYQLAEFIRAGASVNADVALYSDGAGGGENSTTRFGGTVYGDYFWTGRTRLRLEVGTGIETQDSGASSLERTYTQALFRVNYRAAEKLTIDAGLGVGVTEETPRRLDADAGLRVVYSLTFDYAPTEKTSARLYLGLEAATIEPDASLTVTWHPRTNTYVQLSVYQQTGLSNLVFAQNRTSQGFLGSVRQRFFDKIDLTLSGGFEREKPPDDEAAPSTVQTDGYYFMAVGLSWEMNRWAAWQVQSRIGSRRDRGAGAEDDLETRSSVSLRLTF